MRGYLTCLVFVAVACADALEGTLEETEVSPELEGKADESDELSVRAGETTLWVRKSVARREGPNGPEYVLRGRTSRTLVDGRGFIFDDVYSSRVAARRRAARQRRRTRGCRRAGRRRRSSRAWTSCTAKSRARSTI